MSIDNSLKETIIEAIRTQQFSLEDLRSFKNEIDLKLIALIGRRSENKTLNLFYSTISNYLYKNYNIKPIPLKIYENNSLRNFNTLEKCHDYLNDYFKTCLNREASITELYKLYLVYCEMVCDFINQLDKITIRLETVINFYERFPGIVAKNMPNYIESGAFEALVRDKEEKQVSLPNKKDCEISDLICKNGGLHIWKPNSFGILACERCGIHR